MTVGQGSQAKWPSIALSSPPQARLSSIDFHEAHSLGADPCCVSSAQERLDQRSLNAAGFFLSPDSQEPVVGHSKTVPHCNIVSVPVLALVQGFTCQHLCSIFLCRAPIYWPSRFIWQISQIGTPPATDQPPSKTSSPVFPSHRPQGTS
jgi:hypothetical protein